jgi:hypothetical protein
MVIDLISGNAMPMELDNILFNILKILLPKPLIHLNPILDELASHVKHEGG